MSWVSRLALLASLRAAIIVSNAPDSLVDFHAAIGGGAASERGKLPGLPPVVLLDRPYRAVTWETERGGWHCRAPGVPSPVKPI